LDLPYLPAGSGERFFFRELTIVSCVDLVVGRDVGCCKIWTTWTQAASFMSKVGRFDQFEQSKISILTVTSLGIVMLTVDYDVMVSV